MKKHVIYWLIITILALVILTENKLKLVTAVNKTTTTLVGHFNKFIKGNNKFKSGEMVKLKRSGKYAIVENRKYTRDIPSQDVQTYDIRLLGYDGDKDFSKIQHWAYDFNMEQLTEDKIPSVESVYRWSDE